MDSHAKTTEKKPEEDCVVQSHGITFVKTREPEHDIETGKSRTALQAEFSTADNGIEIEECSSEKTKGTATFIMEDKKDEAKDTLQKVSENKVVILPEADIGREFLDDEYLPLDLNKRKQ